MKVSEVLFSEKTAIGATNWTGEKIRTKDFPLNKGRFPLTKRWRWRLERFEALRRQFRLLIAYHITVPEFLAVLGEEVAGDCRVIASLEYHRSHPGWHVHSSCEHCELLPIGQSRPPAFKRIPRSMVYHRNVDFLPANLGMTDTSADDIAMDFFHLDGTGDLFSRQSLPW